ncbi:MAG: polyphosphate kinase 1 [Acidimicrobiales bacterium]
MEVVVIAPVEAQGDSDRNSKPVAIEDDERFLNRERSWCDFAERLLDLAADTTVPLLERAKFIAICASGMDEFFQVRVAGLKDQIAAGVRTRSSDGMSAGKQLKLIRERCRLLTSRQDEIFNGSLIPELARAGVELMTWSELTDDERGLLLGVFDREIFPVLTPLAVDPGHPFPYISNLSLNLGVLVADEISGEHRFARVKVPPVFPRFVQVGEANRFVVLEEVIAANLHRLFPQMTLGGHHAFRVTRNADLALETGEADDLLVAVEVELRRRRFGRAVRLEVGRGMPAEVRDLLLVELDLGPDDVYETSAPIDLSQLWELHRVDRPDLHDPPWVPMTPPRLATAGDEPVDLFAVLRERDVLVHHPYDSFASSVEAFVNQAADDPKVLAIKQTLYRTSNDTEIVDALVRAAEQGKQVAALVELKARFDEQANISWARQLEQAGVHVVYGLMGLKTHSKTALVIRREDDTLRGYCHVGTGNYNSGTARVYEDLGLLSADPDLCADLTELFNYLTGYGRQSQHRRIVTSPHELRSWLLGQLAEESRHGSDGRATIKVNGLTDPEVIDAFYRASGAGVRLELIVRGLCSLRPGVPGLSETITVRSIVGRFLEHSRIYRFGDPESERGVRHYFGSADLMERNLDRRIEALAPVLDPELKARLDETLAFNLADDTNTWELGPDGAWKRLEPQVGFSTQRRLQELALARARKRRAPDLPV